MPPLVFRHRVLYVGDDPDLAGLLMTALRRHACQVVREPASHISPHGLLGSGYALLLLDDTPECRELARRARAHVGRARTPVIFAGRRADLRALADAIARHLPD